MNTDKLEKIVWYGCAVRQTSFGSSNRGWE